MVPIMTLPEFCWTKKWEVPMVKPPVEMVLVAVVLVAVNQLMVGEVEAETVPALTWSQPVEAERF